MAVIVHNDVVKDARVLKEVATLGAAGYVVDVIGASPKPGNHPVSIPGARSLRVLDISPSNLEGKFYRFVNRIYPLVVDYSLVLLAITPLSVVIAYTQLSESFARSFILTSPLLLLGVRSTRSNTRQRRHFVRVLTTLLAIAIAVVGILGIVAGQIDIVTVLLVVLTLFAVDRINVRWRKTASSYVNRLRSRRLAGHRRERWRAIAKQLASAVDPTRHDVVHCHDIIALIAGVRLKESFPHLRLVWDAHEYYEEVASGTDDDRALVREIIRSAEGKVDAFVTISESFREIYAREYPGLPTALVVMNATRSAGVVEYDGRLHRAAGLSIDRRILLFQGGFSPHRGIGHLIEAARNLPDPWSIVLMGWGRMEPDIIAASDELTDPQHPERAPLVAIPTVPQAELPYWTAGATLGAIPYENVGQNHLYCTPNKLWEFPNAGVPILATALVEMERIIRTWKTGFLLPRNFTANDVLGRLAEITEDELAQARHNCRKFSAAMSWDRFEGEFLKAYTT